MPGVSRCGPHGDGGFFVECFGRETHTHTYVDRYAARMIHTYSEQIHKKLIVQLLKALE